MASDKEISEALKQLLDYFTPKDMNRGKLNVYRQQLQRLDGGVLKDAVSRCLETLTWFPKLNELFAIANELPVKAKYPDQLRALAFDLEKKYGNGIYITDEWMNLADAFGRLHRDNARLRILERMEVISGCEDGAKTHASAVSGDATEFKAQNGMELHNAT